MRERGEAKGRRYQGDVLRGGEARSRGRNLYVDGFRIGAAILIVAIHTSPLASYSELADFILTRIVARVAVPFFFMVTGYYVLPGCLGAAKDSRRQRQRTRSFWQYENKNLMLYGLAILLYLPVNWYAGNLKEAWTVGGVLQELFFQGTFYHLWYLPGLLLGLLLVYGLGKLVPFGGMLLVSLLLYVVGLGGDSYYGWASQWEPAKSFYDWIFTVSPYTRNGVFFAPIFLSLGYGLALMRRRSQAEAGERRGKRWEQAIAEEQWQYSIGLLVSGILLLAEGLWLHACKWQRHDSMYVSLLPVMVCLFSLLLTGEGRGFGGSGMISIAQWTTWVYVLHPLGIILVRGVAKAGKLPIFIENSLLHFLAVVLVSAGMAAVVCLLSGYQKRRGRLGAGRREGRKRI
ncbi:MAG: acyltransferase [Lachnospiraceae bacterium]|nr:acyltransferase [Lachnospiraceae bacterium]